MFDAQDQEHNILGHVNLTPHEHINNDMNKKQEDAHNQWNVFFFRKK